MSEYIKYTITSAASALVVYNAIKLTNEELNPGEGCKTISYLIAGTTAITYNHIYPSKILLAIGTLSAIAWYIPGYNYTPNNE